MDGWRRQAWRAALRYWQLVGVALMLVPVWVAAINREGGIDGAERLAIAASLLRACLGVGLFVALRWIDTGAGGRSAVAVAAAHQLGIALIGVTVVAAIGSLVTMTGVFFLATLLLLTIPAGLLAGTSAEPERN